MIGDEVDCNLVGDATLRRVGHPTGPPQTWMGGSGGSCELAQHRPKEQREVRCCERHQETTPRPQVAHTTSSVGRSGGVLKQGSTCASERPLADEG